MVLICLQEAILAGGLIAMQTCWLSLMLFKLNPGRGESICRLIHMNPCEESIDRPDSDFNDGGSSKKLWLLWSGIDVFLS